MTVDGALGPVAVSALAAALVGVSTLATRRWGHGVGGVLSAFPLIVGPVLLIAAERHGAEFAARAAAATLLGLVALAGFASVYAWSAARSGWAASLLLAWGAAAVLGTVAGRLDVGLLACGACAVAAIAAARAGLPTAGAVAPMGAPPRWDLPARMVLTALLILLLTAAANRFGPVAAGALSALPALASVLAVATHRREGRDALVALLGGTLEGTAAFAVFCAVVGGLLERTGVTVAFALAGVAAVLAQAGLVRAHARRRPPRGDESVRPRGSDVPWPAT